MSSKIIEKIKKEEGDKARMYKCPAGYWTIGAGINLEVQEMPQDIRDLWLAVIVYDIESSVSILLDRDYDVDLYSLRENVQLVLIDMAYQMGVSGLFQFKKMLSAILAKDYPLAADELLNSNYARQTPNRANRNAQLLRGCADG